MATSGDPRGGVRESPVRLVDIGPEIFRDFLALAVAPSQQAWVASPERILARAWAYREHGAEVHGIVAGGTPVGLMMTRVHERALVLEELLIDARHQGRGRGSRVLDGLVASARAAGRDVLVTTVAGNQVMEAMPRRRGFVTVPDASDEEELAWRLPGTG